MKYATHYRVIEDLVDEITGQVYLKRGAILAAEPGAPGLWSTHDPKARVRRYIDSRGIDEYLEFEIIEPLNNERNHTP